MLFIYWEIGNICFLVIIVFVIMIEFMFFLIKIGRYDDLPNVSFIGSVGDGCPKKPSHRIGEFSCKSRKGSVWEIHRSTELGRTNCISSNEWSQQWLINFPSSLTITWHMDKTWKWGRAHSIHFRIDVTCSQLGMMMVGIRLRYFPSLDEELMREAKFGMLIRM